MTSISTAAWIRDLPIAISRGKPGTHARIETQASCTLLDWLKWQVSSPREGRMTLNEYVAAEDEAQKADKALAGAHWYSFAHYNDDHRNSDNWQGSNVVVLDADAKCGTEEGARFSFTAAQLRDRLSGLHFLALPTHSYTNDVPRWRIAIPLSEVVTDRVTFSNIAKHIAARLDGNVDPKSYTPEQYWFSLSAPRGEWSKRLSLITYGG